VLVNGAWGFAATNRVEPAAARAAAEQAVAIARANAILATRKVVLADADKVVASWTNPIKRDPFEVPLDTKIQFLMKLNEAAMGVKGVSFVNSQILFVDEQKYFASTEGSRITQRLIRTYPQFSVTAANRDTGDFQSRPVVDRAKLLGYEYVEDYPWLQDAEQAGHEVVEKLTATPIAPGRYDIVVDPSQLFLAIHESVGHSTELDRSLGFEANMAGTSFIKPTDAGKLRFGNTIVNLVGDRTQPGSAASSRASFTLPGLSASTSSGTPSAAGGSALASAISAGIGSAPAGSTAGRSSTAVRTGCRAESAPEVPPESAAETRACSRVRESSTSRISR
jgi:TldD protein